MQCSTLLPYSVPVSQEGEPYKLFRYTLMVADTEMASDCSMEGSERPCHWRGEISHHRWPDQALMACVVVPAN